MATHPGGWAAKAKIITIMDVESFEKAILAHNFNPLQVFYRRGRQVRYFVCTMAGKAKPFDIIVFDKDGQAYVSSGFQKPVGEESIFNIQYFDFDGTLRVNGNILERHPGFDLFSNKTSTMFDPVGAPDFDYDEMV